MANGRIDESGKAVRELYGTENPCFIENEPEMTAIMQNFIYADVNDEVKLPLKDKELLTLVVLTASNTPDDIGLHVKGALKAGATAAEIRETIYQCTPYVGFPRAKAALQEMQQAFKEAGIKVPLAGGGTVNDENRRAKGLAIQRNTFGAENIDKMNESAPADQQHIIKFLSANCFGDYYTREVLDMKRRELITFTAIAVLGGCEPQVKAHAAGNIAVGNTRQDLLNAVTVALPYIGYPRTLNAISCINEIAPPQK